VAKARFYSFLRVRDPAAATQVRVYKLLKDPTYLSLNHLVRLEKPLKITKDKKSKSKAELWLLTAEERARIEAAL